MGFRLPVRLVRKLFGLLYGPLAPAYDVISATFFLGQWRHWQQAVLPYSSGRILEVGAGTGSLLFEARLRGLDWTAAEPSKEMIRQIRKRPGFRASPPVLVRSFVQNLPFRRGAFDRVVSTFPSEYIFDPVGLEELGRVLTTEGTLLVIPGAVLLPVTLLEKSFDAIQRFTEGEMEEALTLPGPVGFIWKQKWVPSPKGRALLLIGRRAA